MLSDEELEALGATPEGRFAQRLHARFVELGLTNYVKVRDADGPSKPTMRKVLHAEFNKLSESTAERIERAAGLIAGSASRSFANDQELEFAPDRDDMDEWVERAARHKGKLSVRQFDDHQEIFIDFT